MILSAWKTSLVFDWNSRNELIVSIKCKGHGGPNELRYMEMASFVRQRPTRFHSIMFASLFIDEEQNGTKT